MDLFCDLLLIGTYLHICVQYSQNEIVEGLPTADNCAKELLMTNCLSEIDNDYRDLSVITVLARPNALDFGLL